MIFPATIDVENFFTDTMGVRWDWARNKLYLTRVAPDTYWNIYSADPDGSNIIPLTYLNPLLPGRNAGAEAMSPDGRFLIFGAEKKDHPCPSGRNFNETPPMAVLGCSFPSLPGTYLYPASFYGH